MFMIQGAYRSSTSEREACAGHWSDRRILLPGSGLKRSSLASEEKYKQISIKMPFPILDL